MSGRGRPSGHVRPDARSRRTTSFARRDRPAHLSNDGATAWAAALRAGCRLAVRVHRIDQAHVSVRPQLQQPGNGGIAITPTPRFRRAEIGYWLGTEHWNHGYTTEAARRIVAFGFAQLGLVRIQATCYPRNPASAKVMQKIGMAYEGLLRGYSYKDGIQEDIAMYAMLRSDWDGVGQSGSRIVG